MAEDAVIFVQFSVFGERTRKDRQEEEEGEGDEVVVEGGRAAA